MEKWRGRMIRRTVEGGNEGGWKGGKEDTW